MCPCRISSKVEPSTLSATMGFCLRWIFYLKTYWGGKSSFFKYDRLEDWSRDILCWFSRQPASTEQLLASCFSKVAGIVVFYLDLCSFTIFKILALFLLCLCTISSFRLRSLISSKYGNELLLTSWESFWMSLTIYLFSLCWSSVPSSMRSKFNSTSFWSGSSWFC